MNVDGTRSKVKSLGLDTQRAFEESKADQNYTSDKLEVTNNIYTLQEKDKS